MCIIKVDNNVVLFCQLFPEWKHRLVSTLMFFVGRAVEQKKKRNLKDGNLYRLFCVSRARKFWDLYKHYSNKNFHIVISSIYAKLRDLSDKTLHSLPQTVICIVCATLGNYVSSYWCIPLQFAQSLVTHRLRVNRTRLTKCTMIH